MDAKNNELNAMIPTANNVASVCHPAEMAEKNTALMPAEQQPIGNVMQPDATFTNTKRHINVTANTITCAFCSRDFEAKRPKQARYCNATCRRKAWLKRNPEKAAELVESSKARLRVHLESKGITWVPQ